MNHAFLASLLLLAFALSPGEAIKCFECNSHNNSACAQEIPPDSLKKDCSDNTQGSNYVLCRKIVQSIEHEVNGLQPDSRIIRSCGWDDSSYMNRCYQRSGFGGRQEVCSCSTDFCNGSPLVAATFLTTALLVAAPLFL